MSFRSSAFSLSVLVATSSLSFFAHPTAAQPRNATAQPQVATVESMVDGDLMCYVTLVDENGIKYREVGATFELCAKKNTFLNKKVNLVYGKVSVNDCQSAEPCGKTRQQTLILQMKLAASETPQSQSSNSLPKVARVEKMVNGDLMCYVTLVAENGTKKEVGATFKICEQKNAFLNKKVNLVYGQVSVNDCQSAEPCGKTRQQTLIVQMKLADLGDRR